MDCNKINQNEKCKWVSKSGERKIRGRKTKINLVYKTLGVQFCHLPGEGHKFGSKPFGAKPEKDTQLITTLVFAGLDEPVVQEQLLLCGEQRRISLTGLPKEDMGITLSPASSS